MTKKHYRTKGRKPEEAKTDQKELLDVIRHRIIVQNILGQSITTIADFYRKEPSTISRNLADIKDRAKCNYCSL